MMTAFAPAFFALFSFCAKVRISPFSSPGALNQRDFAREGLAGEIGRCTDTADHIRIGAVQACDLLGSCFCRVAVPNLSVTDQKIRRGGFYVVHACDGKRRVIRRRRCDRTVIRIGRQRQVSAALALVGRAVLIAGRTHQADTRILYPLVDLLHLGFRQLPRSLRSGRDSC